MNWILKTSRDLISERTKAGLEKVKAQGWSAKAIEGRLKGNANSAAVPTGKADEYAQSPAGYIRDYRRQHCTFREICASLERAGIATPGGGKAWHPNMVKRLVDRLPA